MELPTTKPPAVLVETLATKGKKIESSEPSLQMQSLKKKKEQTPELEELDESMETIGSSSDGTETEEETEPATPRPEKAKGVETRSFDRKKSASAVKTPVAPKRPMKTPQRRGSSHKKPKGK